MPTFQFTIDVEITDDPDVPAVLVAEMINATLPGLIRASEYGVGTVGEVTSDQERLD